MADKSAIEWTNATWNPFRGCTKVSPGCDHCYAERIVERFHGKGAFANVEIDVDKLDIPLRWRKPRRVFVNSMSDLFHDDIPDAFVAAVFAVMTRTPRHTYQILTKRHGRMQSLVSGDLYDLMVRHLSADSDDEEPVPPTGVAWPLPNVHLGVSIENQKWAEIRIPALLGTPAAVRWLSCEPLLGPIDLTTWVTPRPDSVDWVVVGGESGHGARPMHPDWVRPIRDMCSITGTPFFLKQWGAWALVDRDDATHLLHVDGSVVDRRDATMDNPYGENSGLAQDLVDRGHPGWVRVKQVGKKTAGRVLDGRIWDEYPDVTP